MLPATRYRYKGVEQSASYKYLLETRVVQAPLSRAEHNPDLHRRLGTVVHGCHPASQITVVMQRRIAINEV